MTKNDGGPAFPRGIRQHGRTSRGLYAKCLSGPICGMTLRDWFAGQALAALIANPNTPKAVGAMANMLAHGRPQIPAADRRYMFADAMLAEREKRHGE